MSETGTNDNPVLILPIIGRVGDIDCLDKLEKKIEIPGINDDGEKNRLIQSIWRALGDYLWDSEDYKKIIKLLFPSKGEIDVNKLINISVDDLGLDRVDNYPLFARLLVRGRPTIDSTDKNRKKILSAAWSALMLELGEFHLDEQFDSLKKDIEENLLKYLCTPLEKSDEHTVLYALFDSHPQLIGEIWDKILGQDIFLAFVDDNKTFANRWGLSELRDASVAETSEGECVTVNKVKINVLGFVPGKIGDVYNRTEVHKCVLEQISKEFELFSRTNPNALPVFVVDLLFRDSNSINRIEGDDLIKELRSQFGNSAFIIGFTGGRSPFVINSAVKAGADIVIMKERGGTVAIPNSHGSGNPGGLFDLMWALSKNITRWRFLEMYYKEAAPMELSKNLDFYRQVLDRLFFSIENESPFWKKYLKEWQTKMENLRLEVIFASSSHE